MQSNILEDFQFSWKHIQKEDITSASVVWGRKQGLEYAEVTSGGWS